jgi:succinate dehydrogenase / fumarate reductase cytochrome b subunit
MNVAAVFSADAYNAICALLGAKWYAVGATMALGALAFLHIVYSMLLTLQNRKARGLNRYAVQQRPKGVSWASQNMFLLGAVVCGFLLLHLWQFWHKMMFAELNGLHEVMLNGRLVSTQDGYAFIGFYFSQPWVVVAYLLWYVALWLHLTHGFWSAFQSLGWNNHTWLERWKWIGNALSTLIMIGFAFVTLSFFVRSLIN